jgi:hypothetical protein
MNSVVRRLRGSSVGWVVGSLVALAALPGCNKSGGQRTDEAEQIAQLPNKVTVAKFAGHVSVDGQPPAPDAKEGTLFVVLNDPQHLDKGAKAQATCDADGNFAFTTYAAGDGAPTGKYVVTFVQLPIAATGGRAGGVRRPSLTKEYGGPDGLKNLYNDPEKNKDNPTFVVDITPPGRTDYDFSLTVAGKEPVKTPGQYATRQLRTNFAPIIK